MGCLPGSPKKAEEREKVEEEAGMFPRGERRGEKERGMYVHACMRACGQGWENESLDRLI